jgi:hypothetical protein
MTFILTWLAKIAIGSKLKKIMASPMALGTIILWLLVLWYYLFHHLPVVHQRDVAMKEKTQAVKALNDYTAAQSELAKAAIAENALKLEQARSAASFAEVEAKNEIAEIEWASQKTQAEIAENIRSEYENKLNAMPFTYSVLPQAVGDSNREAETASAARELTEGGRIYRTACAELLAKKESLEIALGLETIYYNQLKFWADSACKQIGCESLK